jgi:hypothetical protein
MEENGLDPVTWVEEAGFDILCPPPYEAVKPSDTRISCFYAHDVICKGGEILACDHPDSKDNCKAFVKTMEKFVLLFRYSNEDERNLLAWSIVAILRRRGGRFLVCDKNGDTSNVKEGGDPNALQVVMCVLQNRAGQEEAKGALREAECARAEERRARKRKRTVVEV